MRVVKIPKKRAGEYRTIYVPDDSEKAELRSRVGRLEEKSANVPGADHAHGFRRGRSPVTNATPHVGYEFTLTMDLEDFFDTVGPRQLRGKLTKEELAAVLVDGAARQGLPTSPAVANLAASDLDRAVEKLLKKRAPGTVYTRYADDLAFSFDSPETADLVWQEVPKIASRMGFAVNAHKTKLQCARAGRRVITGVAVGEDAIHVPREIKRKLRAATHQGNEPSVSGLREWSKLKSPRPPEVVEAEERREAEIEALRKAWKVRVPRGGYPEKGEDERLSDGVIVTGDPVYALGLSTLTTGWKSCMAQPGGRYASGCSFWATLRGARIAAYLSSSKITVSGVTRKKMRARALVYSLRDGSRVYDRLYGNPGDTAVLQRSLEDAGYVSVQAARNQGLVGARVVGHVPARMARPYLDSMRASGATATSGRWAGKPVVVVEV